jgi:hypothetical protein
MALRLIEMVLQEKDGAEVRELFKEHRVLDHKQARLPDGEVLVWILLDAEQIEAVLDLLEKRYAGAESTRVLIRDTAVEGSDCGPHLGRTARRHFVGHGALAAGQLLAQSGADPHVFRRSVLDPCSGPDGGPGDSEDRQSDGGPSVFFRTLMVLRTW